MRCGRCCARLDAVMSESMRREAQRAAWRRKLMETPDGVAWLVHVSRLFGHVERLIGPEHIGLPDALRARMLS